MENDIAGFLATLRKLQKIDAEFPLQYAICLCEIAQEEGLSITTLALKTGMPLSTISRIVGALSKKRQKGKPYGLIHVEISPTERRKKELYLTERGKEVISSISTTIDEYLERRPKRHIA